MKNIMILKSWILWRGFICATIGAICFGFSTSPVLTTLSLFPWAAGLITIYDLKYTPSSQL